MHPLSLSALTTYLNKSKGSNLNDYFTYNKGSDLPADAFRISPSQISRFFDDTPSWYREFLLGEEGFTGNTSTELGSVVHAAAEMYSKEGTIYYDQLDAYINSLPSDMDKAFIFEQYPGMVEVLINQYLSFNKPIVSELFLSTEVLPGIYLAGTLDSIASDTITLADYKSTSSNSPPTKISRPYYFQQLAYAYLARKHGYDIRFIRLIFITTNELNRVSDKTGKRLKDYPSVVSTVNYEITPTDMDIIENTIKLVAESVQSWQTNPELRYLLAQDYRLKLKQRPKLFK